MEFIGKIKEKSPGYDPLFEELIAKFTLLQGGKTGTSSESDLSNKGKFFFSRYEIFLYAAMLGLKKDYPIPLTNTPRVFMPMKNWTHQDLTDYMVASVLTKSGKDLFEIEKMDQEGVETVVTDIRKLIESYANGGFDLIRGKFEKEPSFFEGNDNCFIDLLDEVKCPRL